jgi:chorismate mutase
MPTATTSDAEATPPAAVPAGDADAMPTEPVAAAGVDPSDPVPTLRHQIDAIDESIARLVAERVRLSRRIQTARINAGGTRVQLGRERVILDRYRAVLGSDGPLLGEAVLRVSRGER